MFSSSEVSNSKIRSEKSSGFLEKKNKQALKVDPVQVLLITVKDGGTNCYFTL